MAGKSKWTEADQIRCASAYGRLKSVEKVSKETGIPIASVHRLLKRGGVRIQAPGEAHKGRPWSPARRAHHPERPKRPADAPRGYEIATARALGNKSRSGHGYVTVHTGRKRKQYEHILVAERAIGRPLKKGEVVHHINCDRTDNRPENLLICRIGYHLKLHARMRKHPYWSQF